ncbi:MAG TPA: pantoate--beta-alanine ligase [Actinomycetota bacterium]|nr:pantoate--beta-alanine ligase [Actinomycetota bacterium]
MKVVRTVDEVRAELAPRRSAGAIGLVPTMGALHDGHRSLLRAARQAVDAVVVSLFVNPLQFGPHEDFSAYPRGESADLATCEQERADVVFAPNAAEMAMESGVTTVTVAGLSEIVEGAARPSHFQGVCTVVAKLLNIVRPDTLFLGQKDAQQNAVIARLVADLSYGVSITVCPTVREPDGLALSSRNAYLSRSQRADAAALHRALLTGRERIEDGATVEEAERAMQEVLAAQRGVEPDYARAVDPHSFKAPQDEGPVLLVVAARVGEARLIDNLTAHPGRG